VACQSHAHLRSVWYLPASEHVLVGCCSWGCSCCRQPAQVCHWDRLKRCIEAASYKGAGTCNGVSPAMVLAQLSCAHSNGEEAPLSSSVNNSPVQDTVPTACTTSMSWHVLLFCPSVAQVPDVVDHCRSSLRGKAFSCGVPRH
jgi:hypothetical protein